MKIKANDLSGILDDNNQSYLNSVYSAVAHADSEATVSVRKSGDGLMFHIEPSSKDFKQDLIKNILGLHKLMNITTNFSKSINISNTVSFSVKM